MLDRLLRHQTVDKYRILDVIGEGRFSKVKKAVIPDTKAEFAVKIVDRRQLVADDMETELARELASMKRINSKHVVAFVDEIYTPEKVYIFMELMKGGKLFDRIASKGRLEEPLARKYFKQLLAGLEACHRLNICHRDLKPENLLLDEADNLKLSDFGFSCCTTTKGGEASLSVAYGTLSYMAPEMFAVAERKLDRYCGKKCDIWSCGVILFVMLTGMMPWLSHDDEEKKAMIKEGKFAVPSYVSAEAKDLISGILSIDSTKRLALEDIKNHPWMQAQGITRSVTAEKLDENVSDAQSTRSGVPSKEPSSDSLQSNSVADLSSRTSVPDFSASARTETSLGIRQAELIRHHSSFYTDPTLNRSAVLAVQPMMIPSPLIPESTKKFKGHFMTRLPIMDLTEHIDEVLTGLELPHQLIENGKIRVDLDASCGKCSLLLQIFPAGFLSLVHISRILGDFEHCDMISSRIVETCQDIVIQFNPPEAARTSSQAVPVFA